MIPISQLYCFLQNRKFSFTLVATLTVTAVAQINPVRATEFKENTDTLKTLNLNNVKPESINTDVLSQDKKPLTKELSETKNLINNSDFEKLSNNHQDGTIIQRLKTGKRNYRLLSRLNSRHEISQVANNPIVKSNKNYPSEFINQNISEPEFLATDKLDIKSSDNTSIQAQN
ncbi:MAG: hypothetical protein WBA41_18665, partial [Rivularia sp. (in: cyanobacteria)]